MKLYLAGNSGHGVAGEHREEFLLKIKAGRMVSFWWYREEGDFHKWWKRLVKKQQG